MSLFIRNVQNRQIETESRFVLARAAVEVGNLEVIAKVDRISF